MTPQATSLSGEFQRAAHQRVTEVDGATLRLCNLPLYIKSSRNAGRANKRPALQNRHTMLE